MPYIHRTPQGAIASLAQEPSPEHDEFVAPNDAELLDFLKHSQSDELTKSLLRHSDLDLVRVVEDLVELLIAKNIILFTELPEEAQVKLLGRKQVRETLQEESSLVINRDDVL